MNLSAFRYIRIRKMVLGGLVAVWLALALHPCAMAYARFEAASSHHGCNHCPPPVANDSCELSDWAQSHATLASLSHALDAGQFHTGLVQSFVALAIWQPDSTGLPPPLLRYTSLLRPPPLSRQDQLRL